MQIDPSPNAQLEALREEIDAIDARIVALLGERFDCTARVGHLKNAHQLPAVDAAREARQMAQFERWALAHKVPPALVQQLFRSIVDAVVDNHKQLAAPPIPLNSHT